MRWRASVLAITWLGVVAGCTSGGDGGGGGAGEESIRVFAAASLTDAFGDIADTFEARNDGVTVELNFAGSSALRQQIVEGAPADVFASADEQNMAQLVDAGQVEDPAVFATNRLQIVVPADDPGGVRSLEDFADGALLIGLCAEEVPCGDLARRALAAAGVTPSIDTYEPDVRALLTKVEAGELDAGLVYATDVASAGDRVVGIDLPSEADLAARYPVAEVSSSGRGALADAFVRFVLGPDGQAILRDHGFGAP